MSNILQSNNYKSKSYISSFKNVALLSKDDEYILAKNFKDKHDINAAKKLVESNLNYVVKIAKNYQGYGIIVKDLIQVGVIGLMKAVNNFDPDKKNRLISFAIYWIKSEIHDYIIKNLKIVKFTNTKNQKKLFFNLKKIRKAGLFNKNEKKVIANLLNVHKRDIDHIESSLRKKDLSIYEKEDNNGKIRFNDFLFHTQTDPLSIVEKCDWLKYVNREFKDIYETLDKRSRKIIFYRLLYKKKYTLKELASMYNISSERIRQLEKNALNKLKLKLNIETKNF
ncbi:MAG TPA: RNA polymerase factor sigma-32 [Candidatus Azoamicus sp. OHIO2]